MKKFNRSIILCVSLLLCFATLMSCAFTPDAETTDTPTTPEPAPTDPVNPEPQYDIITIAEALELCGEPGNITAERYFLLGTIVSIDNADYGAMTIKDETGEIGVYGTYSADGSIGYAEMEDKPYKGDIVLLHCILQNYGGTKEVKNARLISFEKVENAVNEADYTEMDIADARDAEVGAKIKLSGVVAAITYANGKKPSGVMLVDNTQSIYLYDRDIAARVKVGNTVTVLGSKTYWVLDSEKSSANKFGYKGCCQLEDIYVKSIEDTNADFDKSWIEETTIKDILDTPVTENITSEIYKVNALVEKKDGNGFVNYYFYDLDGTTGSYTYTQCNGSDFDWLDEFDGKICTVYLTAINAKSSSTDCFFRFLPISVKDDSFTFDKAAAPEFAVKYFALEQFNTKRAYTGNPETELITSVSSELLGFSGVTVSYASSNEAVAYFTTVEGKTVFNCGESGKATITVTATLDGVVAEKTVEINVVDISSFNTVTVKTAQDATAGSTVTVMGIVGPSVVNQSGFYLFDETGMISVIVEASVFDEIEIGQTVIITGVRTEKKKDDKTHAGQICLTETVLEANLYGNTPYPETGFITDKTLADICKLNVNEYHSTEVYVVKATVEVIEDNYYTSIMLKDGDTSLALYCSSAKQYAFLSAFAGQEVTLEIAPCNWNDKSFYAGCVLAVYADGSKILNELNFKNG